MGWGWGRKLPQNKTKTLVIESRRSKPNELKSNLQQAHVKEEKKRKASTLLIRTLQNPVGQY